MADVPLCGLLSGGLDSSALTALESRALQRDGRGKLSTFSVDFPGSERDFRPDQLRPSHDEPFARRAADHVGSRHTTILLDAGELIGSDPMSMRAHDLPAMGVLTVGGRVVMSCR